MERTKERLEIGVRYCGGCNPVYDRVSVVKRLEKLVPELSFVSAQPGTPYAAAMIVSGCPTACTNVSDLAVPADRQIRIGGFADLLPSRDRIRALLAQEEARTLDHAQVMDVLPHRPPMLFVDTVSRLIPGKEATAELYIDPAWDIFRGHFPKEPVFPGVLAAQAMEQTADIMAMAQDCYAGKAPLLMEMGRVRFLRKIVPGMAVQLHAALLEERREIGVVVCRCQILYEEKVCAEAEMTLAMR